MHPLERFSIPSVGVPAGEDISSASDVLLNHLRFLTFVNEVQMRHARTPDDLVPTMVCNLCRGVTKEVPASHRLILLPVLLSLLGVLASYHRIEHRPETKANFW